MLGRKVLSLTVIKYPGYACAAALFLLLGLLELGPKRSLVISGLLRPLETVEQSLEEQCSLFSSELSFFQNEGRRNAEERCNRWCAAQDKGALQNCTAACWEREEDDRAVQMRRMTPHLANNSGLMFVVWYAVGDKGPMWFPTHQFLKPDMRFADALRRSHPGCRIVIMTDQDTQLAVDDDIEIFRFNINKAVFGRNTYANYFQFQAQVAFLESLEARGMRLDVVFMDMDVLVVDSIAEVFCQDYDYGVTVTKSPGWDPINLGVQYIKASNYAGAISFLQATLDVYKASYMENLDYFTAGQHAISDTCNLQLSPREQNWSAVGETTAAAVRDTVVCHQVKSGHRVCFFSCLRYNYLEDCMINDGIIQYDDPASLARNGVMQALHFTAFRKPGVAAVWDSYVGPGGSLAAAHSAFAALPHDEEGYNKLRERLKERAQGGGAPSPLHPGGPGENDGDTAADEVGEGKSGSEGGGDSGEKGAGGPAEEGSGGEAGDSGEGPEEKGGGFPAGEGEGVPARDSGGDSGEKGAGSISEEGSGGLAGDSGEGPGEMSGGFPAGDGEGGPGRRGGAEEGEGSSTGSEKVDRGAQRKRVEEWFNQQRTGR